MRKNFYIKVQKDKILIFLMKRLFLCQFLLSPSSSSRMSKKVYTFLYLTKVLANYGLIAPSNKNIGF